jgi:hypothetical protein
LDKFNQIFGPRRHLFDHGRLTKEFQDFPTALISERFPTYEPPNYQAAVKERRSLPQTRFGTNPANARIDEAACPRGSDSGCCIASNPW